MWPGTGGMAYNWMAMLGCSDTSVVSQRSDQMWPGVGGEVGQLAAERPDPVGEVEAGALLVHLVEVLSLFTEACFLRYNSMLFMLNFAVEVAMLNLLIPW